MRTPTDGRPRYSPTIEHAAITQARSTDGSHRVIVPNTTSTARPPTSRVRSERRRRTGADEREHERHVGARHREQVREAGGAELLLDLGGSARVSPRRKPARRARSVAGRWLPPRSTRSRSRFATRSTGEPGGSNAVRSSACSSPTACRHRRRVSNPDSGSSQPVTVTRSPASSSRIRAAASPRALSSTVRPTGAPPSKPATRTRTRAQYGPPSGSSASAPRTATVARAAIGAVSAECAAPSSARCVHATPASNAARIASANRTRPQCTSSAAAPHSSAPVSAPTAGAGPPRSPSRIPTTVAPRSASGPPATTRGVRPSPAARGRRTACRRCRGRTAARSRRGTRRGGRARR